MDLDAISARISDLIVLGSQVAPRPREEQYDYGPIRLQAGPYALWRTQSMSMLSTLLPADHVYRAQFEELTAYPLGPTSEGPSAENLNSGVGVRRR